MIKNCFRSKFLNFFFIKNVIMFYLHGQLAKQREIPQSENCLTKVFNSLAADGSMYMTAEKSITMQDKSLGIKIIINGNNNDEMSKQMR